ncbi:hypothetical protein [Staphylococcus cohnii]
MTTNYEKEIVSAKDDLEFIKREAKDLKDFEGYIQAIEKQIKESDPKDLTINEYNNLVNEYNEYVEEYNERIKVFKELVSENYEGVVE